MHRFIIALSCISMMLAAPISAQDLVKGLDAFLNGDYATARKEYTPLAKSGNGVAQSHLGLMYRKGWGVPQDYKEALRRLTLAVKQGNLNAQFNLGVMNQKGEGVPQDYVIAHMWYNISGANGNQSGATGRDLLAKEMTSEDISKAQAMARVCMNSNYEKCGY